MFLTDVERDRKIDDFLNRKFKQFDIDEKDMPAHVGAFRDAQSHRA